MLVVRWAVPKPLVPTAAHDPLPRSLPASTRPSARHGAHLTAWRTTSSAATTTFATLSLNAFITPSSIAPCCSSSTNSMHASVALATVPGRALRHLAAIAEHTGPTILRGRAQRAARVSLAPSPPSKPLGAASQCLALVRLLHRAAHAPGRLRLVRVLQQRR